MTPFWLHQLHVGYASVTAQTRVVTQVTRKCLTRVYVRDVFLRVYTYVCCSSGVCAKSKSRCNRVTHVTTGLAGVTAGVTHVTTGL